MSNLFLDSSALAKRYVVEPGTVWIRGLTSPTAGNTILVSQITQVEIVSGVMRRLREGAITARTARASRLLVDRHAAREYTVLGLQEPIIRRAEDLLEMHPLRAYDSIQLASALEANRRLLSAGVLPITFISADARLLMAARSEGLATDDPGAHA